MEKDKIEHAVVYAYNYQAHINKRVKQRGKSAQISKKG